MDSFPLAIRHHIDAESEIWLHRATHKESLQLHLLKSCRQQASKDKPQLNEDPFQGSVTQMLSVVTIKFFSTLFYENDFVFYK